MGDRPKGADSLLQDHADELIDYLRCLKTEGTQRGGQSADSTSDTPWTDDRVATLFSKLLPTFQSLATSKSHDTREAPQKTEETKLAGLPVPAATLITKWTPADFSAEKPPLPKVLDPKLEAAALTHSGNNKSSGVNYERLEWVGDAYLEVIATVLIHHTFPTLHEGRCAQIRELLVRNATLSEYTRQYGLDKRAKLPEEFTEQGRKGGTKASDKMVIKALGDLLEAYVGAVILSDPKDGVRRVADWLKVLWAPIIQQQLKEEERRGPETNILPKTELERLIGTNQVQIKYQDLPSHKKHKDNGLQLFTVGCFLYGWGENGKQLGFGTALSKKEAGHNAAKMALENKKLLKVYMDKKKAFTEARLAAQAAQKQAEETSK